MSFFTPRRGKNGRFLSLKMASQRSPLSTLAFRVTTPPAGLWAHANIGYAQAAKQWMAHFQPLNGAIMRGPALDLRLRNCPLNPSH